MTAALNHAVKLTIGSGGDVDGEITCTAPPGSPCRMTCPTKQCASWDGASCECGPLVAYPAGCLAAEWFDADGVVDSYLGEDAEIRSGLVEVEWHGGGYGWSYPAAPDQSAPQPNPVNEVGVLRTRTDALARETEAVYRESLRLAQLCDRQNEEIRALKASTTFEAEFHGCDCRAALEGDPQP